VQASPWFCSPLLLYFNAAECKSLILFSGSEGVIGYETIEENDSTSSPVSNSVGAPAVVGDDWKDRRRCDRQSNRRASRWG